MSRPFENLKKEILKMVFTVGSTYITQENINPSEFLGFGTWERVKGRVLVGLDENDTDFNQIGKIGGEKTHKLTVDEMPSHTHKQSLDGGSSSEASAAYNWILSTARYLYEGNDLAISAGGNQHHNNLQPYQVVGYMWIRMA